MPMWKRIRPLMILVAASQTLGCDGDTKPPRGLVSSSSPALAGTCETGGTLSLT